MFYFRSLLHHTAFISFIAIIAIGCSESTIDTQASLAEVAPTMVSLKFDNEHVSLNELEIPSKQSINSFQAPDRVYFALSPVNMAITQDDNSEQLTLNTGDTGWYPKGSVSMENLSSEPIKLVSVSRKYPNLPGVKDNALLNDITEAAEGKAILLLDNDNVRVYNVDLPSGDTIQSHYEMNSLIYGLNNMVLDIHSDDGSSIGEKMTIDAVPGTTEWIAQGNYIFINSGEIPAKFIIFSFKN